jgi:hypothetical protein
LPQPASASPIINTTRNDNRDAIRAHLAWPQRSSPRETVVWKAGAGQMNSKQYQERNPKSRKAVSPVIMPSRKMQVEQLFRGFGDNTP